jgi:hypothetical protein
MLPAWQVVSFYVDAGQPQPPALHRDALQTCQALSACMRNTRAHLLPGGAGYKGSVNKYAVGCSAAEIPILCVTALHCCAAYIPGVSAGLHSSSAHLLPGGAGYAGKGGTYGEPAVRSVLFPLTVEPNALGGDTANCSCGAYE